MCKIGDHWLFLSFEHWKLLWFHSSTLLSQNQILYVITTLKRSHLWFFFLAESFYVILVNQTVLVQGLFSWMPVGQISHQSFLLPSDWYWWNSCATRDEFSTQWSYLERSWRLSLWFRQVHHFFKGKMTEMLVERKWLFSSSDLLWL